MNSLEKKIDKLESIEEIKQLVAKYAVSLDMRAIDMHVNLFVEDVKVGKEGIGRKALKIWADKTFRDQFTGTSHHIGNHIIEFIDPDNALGLLYSKNEHETDNEWIIMQMLYWDAYKRVDGIWYFQKRLPMYWYATDLNKPPLGSKKMRWPDQEAYEGYFHDLFPTWKEFWDSKYNRHTDVSTPALPNEFLRKLRGNSKPPKIKVR